MKNGKIGPFGSFNPIHQGLKTSDGMYTYNNFAEVFI